MQRKLGAGQEIQGESSVVQRLLMSHVGGQQSQGSLSPVGLS